MPSIQITDVSTYKNSTWTKEVLFNPFSRDLVLAMDFNISPDIANTPNVILTMTLEIIEFRTNNVVFYNTYDWRVPLTWQYLYETLGPLSPDDIGLNWVGGDIFGLRTSVEAAHYQNPDGDIAFDCLAVSDIVWFRLEDIYTL